MTTARCARRCTRRYTRIQAGEIPLPDLLLIDGGRGQVNAVLPVLAELGFGALPVIGVSKGPDRKPGQERLHRGDTGLAIDAGAGFTGAAPDPAHPR